MTSSHIFCSRELSGNFVFGYGMIDRYLFFAEHLHDIENFQFGGWSEFHPIKKLAFFFFFLKIIFLKKCCFFLKNESTSEKESLFLPKKFKKKKKKPPRYYRVQLGPS